MPGKVILIIFPHNFTSLQSGVQKRFSELVRFFNQRGFTVDMIGFRSFQSDWLKNNGNKELPGIRNLFLYDHSKGLKRAYLRNLVLFRFGENDNLLEKRITRLPDYAFKGIRTMFNKIINQNSYEYILISYVQWANLIRGNKSIQGKTILTIEDCISRNIAENHSDPIPLNQLLSEEADRVDLFDKVICLSWEELNYFKIHTTKPSFHYVPVFMDKMQILPEVQKEYDILFVGSNNLSNQRGIKWFFDFVYPYLHKNFRILCLGKIIERIPKIENVQKIEFIENIHEVYQKSILTINPLQDGTGMKVKVIESLAHGIPVVSTHIGLSGIKPEVQQLFMIADEPVKFADIIHRLISDNQKYIEYRHVTQRIFRDNFCTEVATKELDKIFKIDL